MSNHRDQYKKKPAGFVDTDNGRVVRAVRNEARRRINRADNFARNRGVTTDLEIEGSQPSRGSDNKERIRRWRAERDLKKKIEQKNKKPVFKVGVVHHHHFYSPPVTDRTRTPAQPCHPRRGFKVKHQPTPEKRITRATQKRLDAKKLATGLTPAAPSTSKNASTKKKFQRERLMSAKRGRDLTRSFAPENYTFKAPSGISEIPLFGRIAIPDASNAEQSAMSKIDELDLKLAKEKPWPVQQDLANFVEGSQKMRNQLHRQAAIDRFSQESTAPASSQNSSLEASFRLHVSLEDESTEEKNTDEKNTEEQSSSQHPEPVTTDVAESNDLDMETPPRSGTPVPASFSPYIVTSRGKDSARKEQQTRMGMRRSSANEIPTKDTVMQSLNISVEDEEQTAQYFKFLLQNETKRLIDLCSEWEIIQSEPNLSEDAKYRINAAIGQTKLLIKKKFERFRSLIHDCETGKGEMLVRCKDLGGFWDLMGREVKDCESRFLKLESLRSNDWVEEEIVVKKVTKKKPAPAKVNNAKSSARSFILAARKKKMSQTDDLDNDAEIAASLSAEQVSSTIGKLETPKEQATKKFAQTPKKTPASLLKKVQLSQASKNIRSPLAVMKVSRMCKTPEVTLDESISYVNSDQTPGKGILKKSTDSSGSESCPSKSLRKVDFNDDVFLQQLPPEAVDENLQNSIDLGRALARIESYDSDCCALDDVAIQLNFEDDSCDEVENIAIAESETSVATIPEPQEIPTFNIINPTPTKPRKSKHRKSSTVTRKSFEVSVEPSVNTRVAADLEPQAVSSVNVIKPTSTKSRESKNRRSSTVTKKSLEGTTEPSVNTRVLRTRVVTAETPNTSNRRSTRLSIADKTSTSSMSKKTKENNDPQKETKESALELSNVLDTQQDQEDNTKRRRSTRKSVRFNPEDCTACGEAPKSVQPMTPRSRRNKRISLLGNSTRESVIPLASGDLMGFDSPA